MSSPHLRFAGNPNCHLEVIKPPRCINIVLCHPSCPILFTVPICKHFFSFQETFERCVNLTISDTEAIVRRTTIEAMCSIAMSFYKNDLQHLTAIASCMNDLDWQVKLSVINYCNNILEEANRKKQVPSYAVGVVAQTDENELKLLFEKLSSSGYVSALVIALQDCDITVKHHACRTLYKLKDISNQHITYSSSPHEPAFSNDASSLESPNIEKLLREDPAKMHQFLRHINLPDLQTLSEASIDTYANPHSMLQDLLTAMKPHDENQIIDCY